MARLGAFSVVALIGILAVVFSLTARGADAPVAVAPSVFEYRLVVPKEGANAMPGAEPIAVRDFLAVVQRAGGDGWELVGFDANGGAWLKRHR